MSIKNIKTLSETREEAGHPIFIPPIGESAIQDTPEYLRALEYVKTISRVKNMLVQTIKALPKKSQDAFVSAIKREIRKYDFELPSLDFIVSSVDTEIDPNVE